MKFIGYDMLTIVLNLPFFLPLLTVDVPCRLSTMIVHTQLMGMCTLLLINPQIMADYLGGSWKITELVNVLLLIQESEIQLTSHCGRWETVTNFLIFMFIFAPNISNFAGCKAWWAKLGQPMGSWKTRMAHRVQCNECTLFDLKIWYSWWWNRFDISTSWKWNCPELCSLPRKQC